VLVGTKAKVLDGLSGVLGTSEEKGIASSRSSERQLIQSQSLSTCGKNASTSSCSESESSNAELGDGQETVVISDGANNNNGLVIGLLGGVRNNSRDGDGRSVDAGHEKSAENDLVEGGLGAAWVLSNQRSSKSSMNFVLTCQEAVQLHEQLKVDIVRLWRLAVRVANVMSVEIDTYSENLVVSLYAL